MAKQKYPYLNLSLKDIKGEKWVDLPDLEYYFQVSNFGRVKRLEYEVTFKDGRVYTKKSQIIKPTLVKTPNHFVGDESYFLRTTLNLSGNTYNFSIARMVYYCFISSFDFSDKHLLVTCANGDGKNINPSNLRIVSMHDLRKRIISQKRCENILLRPDIREMAKITMIENQGKLISQYDKEGKRLKSFHSIAEASNFIGLSKSSISGVLRKRKVTAGGFVWRYGKSLRINLEKDMKHRKLGYKKGLRKRLAQYDHKDKKIKIYNSIAEASRSTNICSTTIGKVINGKAKSAGGFYWREVVIDS